MIRKLLKTKRKSPKLDDWGDMLNFYYKKASQFGKSLCTLLT